MWMGYILNSWSFIMGTGPALLQTKGKTVLKKNISCSYPINAINNHTGLFK